MKKFLKFIGFLLVLVAILSVVYRLVNTAPDANLAPNLQAKAILDKGGCVMCHTANPKLPFYSNWPIAKGIIDEDITVGYKEFDITNAMNAIENGGKINEVDLEKIKHVVAEKCSMPPAKYYLIHWGSSMTSTKKDMIVNWANQYRAANFSTNLAAAEFANEPVQPIPDKVNTNPLKVELGKALYNDTRLSVDNTISCASCHDLARGGVDPKGDVHNPFSEGVQNQFGGISAPTVFNAYFNFVQFWDGRAADLAEQAAGPPLNPIEMGCKSFDEIVAKLNEDKAFQKIFLEVYPEGISEKTICDAIGEYEKTLLTPNCRFDKYLKGDKTAITANELKGYELFKKYDCATCHAGVLLGGQSYELLGIKKDYFADRAANRTDRKLNDDDKGRYKQTKEERDMYRQKTPTLRNVELTYPWFHDGTQATLFDAVKSMDIYELALNIPDNEINLIVEFLKTLTGEYQGKLLTNANYKN